MQLNEKREFFILELDKVCVFSSWEGISQQAESENKKFNKVIKPQSLNDILSSASVYLLKGPKTPQIIPAISVQL